ncbi:MAG: hypothetical protein K8R88_06160 [Armatimonadetes bacterium]|nr:hypothetical protein [Armatimonadota bacterium]
MSRFFVEAIFILTLSFLTIVSYFANRESEPYKPRELDAKAVAALTMYIEPVRKVRILAAKDSSDPKLLKDAVDCWVQGLRSGQLTDLVGELPGDTTVQGAKYQILIARASLTRAILANSKAKIKLGERRQAAEALLRGLEINQAMRFSDLRAASASSVELLRIVQALDSLKGELRPEEKASLTKATDSNAFAVKLASCVRSWLHLSSGPDQLEQAQTYTRMARLIESAPYDLHTTKEISKLVQSTKVTDTPGLFDARIAWRNFRESSKLVTNM